MSIKPLLLLLAFFTLFGWIKNQNELLPQTGVLWKISDNGINSASYLLGTYHGLGGTQILDSIKDFYAIFNSTNQLVCEIDFEKAWKRTSESNSKKHNELFKPWPSADSTYENLLNQKQKDLLDSVVETEKVLQAIKNANVRPISLYTYIKLLNDRKKPSYTFKQDKDSIKNQILDWHLQSIARKAGTKIVELDIGKEYESIRDSMNSLTSQLTYKTEVDILMYYIENHAKIDSLNEHYKKKLLDVYLKQDLCYFQAENELYCEKKEKINQKISQYIGNEMYIEQWKSQIIDERNNYWMKKIPDLIIENSCFIAVGAGHIGGEKGIINQLRELGFTVNRVKNKE